MAQKTIDGGVWVLVTLRENRVFKHVRRWNYWRKYNSNGRLHKLLVLLGVIKSPTMVTVLLPEEKVRYFCIDKYIVRRCKETISPLSKDGRQKGETK